MPAKSLVLQFAVRATRPPSRPGRRPSGRRSSSRISARSTSSGSSLRAIPQSAPPIDLGAGIGVTGTPRSLSNCSAASAVCVVVKPSTTNVRRHRPLTRTRSPVVRGAQARRARRSRPIRCRSVSPRTRCVPMVSVCPRRAVQPRADCDAVAAVELEGDAVGVDTCRARRSPAAPAARRVAGRARGIRRSRAGLRGGGARGPLRLAALPRLPRRGRLQPPSPTMPGVLSVPGS
jgi:hypothetical protein